MRLIKTTFQISVLFLLISITPGCSYYQGPSSDHFDGSRFFIKGSDHTFSDEIKWMWEMETIKWPEWINDPPQPPPVKHVKNGELRITYVNHATVLIQMDGINILTDPIWSDRAGPVSWIGPKRVRAPGLRMDDLPKIDIILISHDHYDHLDFPSLEKLVEKHHPLIFTGLGVKSRLESLSVDKLIEMDWWQEHFYSKDIKIIFVPSHHNSGRGLFDSNKTLWGGFVIKGSAGNVLFMGDTAFGEFVEQIKKRFSNFKLAILPLGSYEKRWFMKNQHINPDEAVKIHEVLNVSQSMGIHYATFEEHAEQTIDAHEKDLKMALEKYRVPESRFWVLNFGEGRDVIVSD
ncbi:MBL fold metallo-hydrolase [bacterium]|nr:MBL fold metallo-hydrolase [bacterium]